MANSNINGDATSEAKGKTMDDIIKRLGLKEWSDMLGQRCLSEAKFLLERNRFFMWSSIVAGVGILGYLYHRESSKLAQSIGIQNELTHEKMKSLSQFVEGALKSYRIENEGALKLFGLENALTQEKMKSEILDAVHSMHK